jgi:2'-5' RNA ligase
VAIVSGKHVLYFALQPPVETAERVGELLDGLRGRHRLTAKPTPPERLHVSLNNVGDFKRPPGPVIDKALEAAANVSARRFVVEFNRMGTWSPGDGERPIVLWGDEGVIGVSALYSTIHRALVRPGMVTRREKEISPHMTLLRDRTEMPETFIEPVRWRVDEFVLIHSIHGEGRHEVLGRFPLSG